MTHKERLTEEVNQLLNAIVYLGNTTDEMATADCTKDNPDFVDGAEWVALLDRLFVEVKDFADAKGIETE